MFLLGSWILLPALCQAGGICQKCPIRRFRPAAVCRRPPIDVGLWLCRRGEGRGDPARPGHFDF